jgi:hypothetical protein
LEVSVKIIKKDSTLECNIGYAKVYDGIYCIGNRVGRTVDIIMAQMLIKPPGFPMFTKCSM